VSSYKESIDELKSMARNGCRKKLWPEARNDFRGFPNQYDKIRNIFLLIHKIPGEGFADLDEADIQEM
jgi:hypothetical protein